MTEPALSEPGPTPWTDCPPCHSGCSPSHADDHAGRRLLRLQVSGHGRGVVSTNLLNPARRDPIERGEHVWSEREQGYFAARDTRRTCTPTPRPISAASPTATAGPYHCKATPAPATPPAARANTSVSTNRARGEVTSQTAARRTRSVLARPGRPWWRRDRAIDRPITTAATRCMNPR